MVEDTHTVEKMCRIAYKKLSFILTEKGVGTEISNKMRKSSCVENVRHIRKMNSVQATPVSDEPVDLRFTLFFCLGVYIVKS